VADAKELNQDSAKGQAEQQQDTVPTLPQIAVKVEKRTPPSLRRRVICWLVVTALTIAAAAAVEFVGSLLEKWSEKEQREQLERSLRDVNRALEKIKREGQSADTPKPDRQPVP
jgi:hypothetical protein